MVTSGKKIAVFLGLAAGTALISYAFSKKGKRIKEEVTRKASELKDSMISSVKGKIKKVVESDNIFI